MARISRLCASFACCCSVLAPIFGQGDRGAPPDVLPERLPEHAILHRVDGDEPGDWFGYSVAGAGDLNGDSVPDFVVGAHQNENWGRRPAPNAAPGYARAYSGDDGQPLYTLHSVGSLNIDGSDDHFGYSVASVEDLDGDGVRELLVGAYLYDAGDDDEESVDENTGGAFLFSGATGELLRILPGDLWGDRFGYVVSPIADMDGDGREDLLIGVEKADDDIENQGRIEILSSATFERLVAVSGPGYNAHLGCAVAPLGDVDGDGVPDFAGGAFLYSTADKREEGAVEVFSGATGAKLFAWRGDEPGDQFGFWVAGLGDLDGDGVAEVAAGARQSGWVGDYTGPGYVRVYSVASGALLYERRGDAEGDQFGWWVASAGDRDGDGRDDLLVGAPASISAHREVMLDRPGRLHLLSGADGTRIKTIEGLEENDQFGVSAAVVGDMDGDGLAEVAVGAVENVIGQTRSGYAVIVRGSYLATTYAEELERGAARVLAELDGSAEEGVDPARLAWLHGAALWLWTEHSWSPAGQPSALALVGELRGRLGRDGVAPELRGRAGRQEWNAVVRLRERGAAGDARALIALALGREPTPWTPYVLLEAAALERSCGRRAEAEARLARAERELAAIDPARRDATALEAGVRALRARGALALERGALAEATLAFEAAHALALAFPDARTRPRLVAGALADRVRAASARRAWDDLEAAWSEAQDVLDPTLDASGRAALLPHERAAVQLAYAEGVSRRELERGTLDGAAVAHLELVLAAPGLPLDDELRARTALATTLLDLGRFPRAAEELATARARVAESPAACDPSLASTHSLSLAAAEARMTRAALVGGTLADATPQLNRLETIFEQVVEDWRPLSGGAFPDRAARATALSELINLCLLVHGEEHGAKRALDWVLRAQATDELARRVSLEAGKHGDVQHALIPAKGGLLAYVSGRDGSHAFAVERRSLVHVRLGPGFRIERAARRLAEALAADEPDARAVASERARLSRLLLPTGLRERIDGWKSVTVVELDTAPHVPFELLEFASGEGRVELFGERFAIGYLPSLPFGLWLAARGAGEAVDAEAASVALVSAGPPAAFEAELRARLPGSVGLAAVEPWSAANAAARLADETGVPALVHCFVPPSAEPGDVELPVLLLAAGSAALLVSPSGAPRDGDLGFLEDAYRGMAEEGLSPAEALRRARVARHEAGTVDGRDPLPSLVRVVGLAHARPFTGPLPWWPFALLALALAAALLKLRHRQGGQTA